MLRIMPVTGYRAWGRFIQLPWSIYRSDPNWVPPLKLERRLHLSRQNPYFEHASWYAWIAYRDTQPVGRICAQIDNLRAELRNDATGSFGMLEAVDDPEVFSLLFNTAENWLRNQQIRHIEGPFNLSINDECGLLVEGFETPPSIMMGHARPYYAKHVEACGYHKANDLITYRIEATNPMPPRLAKIAARSKRVHKGQFTLRVLNRKRFAQEIELMRDIFNDGWRDNWGFLPFTEAEFKDVGTLLKMLVDDNYVQIGEIDGKAVSFMVGLPNINEVIADLNGRLFPTGWVKLLWRVKVTRPKSGRVALMGVRKAYQGGLIGSGISLSMIDALREVFVAQGAGEVEMGWVLEQNKSIRSIIEGIGGVVAKRYRLYGKSLV